jgi:hypothetical protein
MKITTDYWPKPIPQRDFDWSAIDEDTYDADWEGEERGFVSKSPIGYGATEEEAIADLIGQFIDEKQASTSSKGTEKNV